MGSLSYIFLFFLFSPFPFFFFPTLFMLLILGLFPSPPSPHFLGSEKASSLPMRSIGKPVMTSSFVNAMPWFMDTTLPTIAISGSAEGPNEIGKSLFLSRVWCLVLYSFAVASLTYINTYELLLLKCSCLTATLLPAPRLIGSERAM